MGRTGNASTKAKSMPSKVEFGERKEGVAFGNFRAQTGRKHLAIQRPPSFNIAACIQMAYWPDLPLDVVRLFVEAAARSDRSTAHSVVRGMREVGSRAARGKGNHTWKIEQVEDRAEIMKFRRFL